MERVGWLHVVVSMERVRCMISLASQPAMHAPTLAVTRCMSMVRPALPRLRSFFVCVRERERRERVRRR